MVFPAPHCCVVVILIILSVYYSPTIVVFRLLFHSSSPFVTKRPPPPTPSLLSLNLSCLRRLYNDLLLGLKVAFGMCCASEIIVGYGLGS